MGATAQLFIIEFLVAQRKQMATSKPNAHIHTRSFHLICLPLRTSAHQNYLIIHNNNNNSHNDANNNQINGDERESIGIFLEYPNGAHLVLHSKMQLLVQLNILFHYCYLLEAKLIGTCVC